MPCHMPSYETGRKSCAIQAAFLGPVVGGGRMAGTARQHNDLQLIRCCGQTVVL